MLTLEEKMFWLWWNTQDRAKLGNNDELAKTAFFAGFESAQPSVQSDLGWTCAHCGRKNTGNICTGCGYGATYRPSR